MFALISKAGTVIIPSVQNSYIRLFLVSKCVCSGEASVTMSIMRQQCSLSHRDLVTSFLVKKSCCIFTYFCSFVNKDLGKCNFVAWIRKQTVPAPRTLLCYLLPAR